MASVGWRIVNVLCCILAIIVLILQITAISSEHWKYHDIYLDRFQKTLPALLLTRRFGLLNSEIKFYDLAASREDEWETDDYVVTTSNRYPMVDTETLMHCTNGPSLRYQLTVCDRNYRSHDCKCRYFDHWLALVVLELTSLPVAALLVICCFLFRTYSQRFLRTVTLLLALVLEAILVAGFILIFQFWNSETQFLAKSLPYYLRSISAQLNIPVPFEEDVVLAPFDRYYTMDNVHIRPGWSAFISLGALLCTFLLTLLIVLSWIIDLRSKTTVRRSAGRVGKYRQIGTQNNT